MGVTQISGKIENFSLKRKDAHARVRVNKDEVLVLSIADRGVLECGTIRRCTEDERYQPLASDSMVRVDLDDSAGGNKTVIAWAPK